MLVLVFLESAWSPLYAGGTWPRERWLPALHRSRSGQRLKIIASALPSAEFEFDNTTPIVGHHPGSRVPPDPCHIVGTITEYEPDVLLLCGRQAQDAVSRLWNGGLVVVPHPAARLLTDGLYRMAALELQRAYEDGRRTLLRQIRGSVLLQDLPRERKWLAGKTLWC